MTSGRATLNLFLKLFNLFFFMTQIHLVIRRINPALKVDLIQIGCIVDGQFKDLPLSDFEHSVISSFVRTGSIADNPFIYHSDISDFVCKLSSLPGFLIEFFDNTFIVMFDFNLEKHEITSKEEGKGH